MLAVKKPFEVGDHVWKEGGQGGYSGPGMVIAVFTNWMGARRYVVGHKIADGVGWFYHIYSDRELTSIPSDASASSPLDPSR